MNMKYLFLKKLLVTFNISLKSSVIQSHDTNVNREDSLLEI